MMARVRARSVPPPNPSQKSASPSSWRAPVRHSRAPTASKAAAKGGTWPVMSQKTKAAVPPVSHPTNGQ